MTKMSRRRDEIEKENFDYEIARQNRENSDMAARLAGFKDRDEMGEYIRIHGEL